MFLRDLAKIIYAEGTASMHRHITVKAYGDGRTVWTGEAKDLIKYAKEHHWLVVEILVDTTDTHTDVFTNKGKIIIVE